MQGKLLILSAPSGSGKTTIAKHLLKTFPELQFSVSACSREKRPGEEEGRDYYFLTAEEFRKKVENDEFVEWEEVYPGQYYGTLRSELQRIWDAGGHVVFDVDVVGGLNIKKKFPSDSLSIFIQAPSLGELEKRLRARSTESEDSIRKRVGKARKEMESAHLFDKVLINDRLVSALKEVEKLVGDFLG